MTTETEWMIEEAKRLMSNVGRPMLDEHGELPPHATFYQNCRPVGVACLEFENVAQKRAAQAALKDLTMKVGADFVLVMTDAWMRQIDKTDADAIRRMEQQEMSNDPQRRECLIASGFAETCWFSVHQPYTRTPAGIVWDAPEVILGGDNAFDPWPRAMPQGASD